ncbi:MAG: hypothetical protein K6G65_06005 [Lachnospiraceae bacterium]|nr:hypothetical protein [Lachnospiraceae bacterium]
MKKLARTVLSVWEAMIIIITLMVLIISPRKKSVDHIVERNEYGQIALEEERTTLPQTELQIWRNAGLVLVLGNLPTVVIVVAYKMAQ